MIKYFSVLILAFCISCKMNRSMIRDHVVIQIYPYEYGNTMKASAMPGLKPGSEFIKYERRFEYLLINVPQIHLPGRSEERNKIFNLYPDTLEMKRRYLETYVRDKKLAAYVEATIAPIATPGLEKSKTYTVDEMMEVASKFFYCDKVGEDTSVQAHVCVGLNGVKEASWKEDYTLLEAFCYEAIFNDFDNEQSQVWDSFVSKKKESCETFRPNITTLSQYLEDVKLDLFAKMKSDEILKKTLLKYYDSNRANLAFKII